MGLAKGTVIDRLRGIFTDYLNTGDFIRRITKAPKL
jgi:hypothetical protein